MLRGATRGAGADGMNTTEILHRWMTSVVLDAVHTARLRAPVELAMRLRRSKPMRKVYVKGWVDTVRWHTNGRKQHEENQESHPVKL